MTALPQSLARSLGRLWLASALTVPVLAGCGSSGSDTAFAPNCPRPAILRDAADLQRFRGAGRDFLDTTVSGRITGINGSCGRDGSRTVIATLSVGLELTRGPAAVGRRVPVSFFVAVSKGDQVLDKQVYTLQAEFPENTDRVRLTGDSINLRLPVAPNAGAEAYQVTAGFQLTPEELAQNRTRLGRR